ncbi:MAG TPA: aspartate kinase [Nitrospinota bacterium]|nr:aspartate kinase [Nitrospinota bacterium]|tara:strand:- start:29002 stop:30234 length:1233 start_codon:yes stop_codon:yes gene_type:complete
MALIVQKYGGTSVASLEKIQQVARKVCKTHSEGNDIVVVVSAMSGETDRLIGLAQKLSKSPSEREMDMLMSSGERVSAALLAITLNELGTAAQSFTGRQIGMITDAVHMKARIQRITGEKLKEALTDHNVCVVAGFQGIDEKTGNVTTLGRGGSDTSAVAIAVAVKADLCEIYTDVGGVYTTDPKVVPNARKIDIISFDEMLEMASLGAKVLQVRSVEFGKKYNMPIRVKSTFEEGKGTLVTAEQKEMESVVVSAVAFARDQAKITLVGVPDKPGIAARIFNAVAEATINVDMIIQNTSAGGLTDLSFTIPKAELLKTKGLLSDTVSKVGAKKLQTDENIGKVSIIGVGMKSHSGVAAKAFSALAEGGINIMMISTSEIKVSCVVSNDELDKAVKILHDSFDLGKPVKKQ